MKDYVDFSFFKDERNFRKALPLFVDFCENLGNAPARKEGWHYSLATELLSTLVEETDVDFSLDAEILKETPEDLCQNWISWVYSIDASRIFDTDGYAEQVKAAFDRWAVKD